MKLSTKGRYATRIMVYLAMRNDGTPSRKQEIAQAEGISADYAEQILMKLKTAGLVASRRGVKGGFTLTRDPDTVTVAQVLEATEGPIALVSCEADECERLTSCVAATLWKRASAALVDIFSSTTIGDMARRAAVLRAEKTLDYTI